MPEVAEEAEDQMVTIRLGFARVFGHMLYFSGFVAFAKGAATGHCICSAPNGILRSAFLRKENSRPCEKLVFMPCQSC